MLNSLLNVLAGATTGDGLIALAASIAILGAAACAIGEATIATKTVEAIMRNPEMESKLRSTMILGVALTETTGIYSLIVSILIIFVLG